MDPPCDTYCPRAAACRRAARGEQEILRRRRALLEEAGLGHLGTTEDESVEVKQLFYNKEFNHVISFIVLL